MRNDFNDDEVILSLQQCQKLLIDRLRGHYVPVDPDGAAPPPPVFLPGRIGVKPTRIHVLDAIYDSEILYVLRSNASIYIHGHSAGGTNPSLVEAMFFGIPIVAFDVVYNKATTDERAYYFKTVDDLVNTLNRTDLDGSAMLEIAKEIYTWKKIAAQYAALY